MSPYFEMLIFDENGKLIRTKDPLKFITRRAKMKGYELHVTAKVLESGLLQLFLDFHSCHIVITGEPLDFFFTLACAIKGKYLAASKE